MPSQKKSTLNLSPWSTRKLKQSRFARKFWRLNKLMKERYPKPPQVSR